MPPARCASRRLEALFKSSFMPGSTASELRRATKSRALALPTSMREIMRSKSKTFFISSARPVRSCKFSKSSFTACWRAFICAKSKSGHSIQLRSLRAPMLVTVKSSTSRSVPRLVPSRMFLTSSRLRMAVASRFINFSTAMRVKRLICVKSALTVLCR